MRVPHSIRFFFTRPLRVIGPGIVLGLFLGAILSSGQATALVFTDFKETRVGGIDQTGTTPRDNFIHAVDESTWIACWAYSHFEAMRIARTTDQGRSWTVQEFDNGTTPVQSLCHIASSGNTVVVAYQNYTRLNGVQTLNVVLLKSTNKGATWTRDGNWHGVNIPPGGPNGNELKNPSLLLLSPTEWLVAANWETQGVATLEGVTVWKTADGGATFPTRASVTNGSNPNPKGRYELATLDGTTIYMSWIRDKGTGQHEGLIARSTNGGQSWTRNWNTVKSDYPTTVQDAEIELITNTKWLHAAKLANSGIWVHRTTNGGSSWTQIQATLGNEGCEAGPSLWHRTLNEYGWGYCSTNDIGIKTTTNDGASYTTSTITKSGHDLDNAGFIRYHRELLAFLAWTDTNNEMLVYRQLPPAPGVVASAPLFGNAQDVAVEWSTTGKPFVRDISGTDRIFRLSPQLSIEKSAEHCTHTIVDFPSLVWWILGPLGFREIRLSDGNQPGLEILSNKTNKVLAPCHITYDRPLAQDFFETGIVLYNDEFEPRGLNTTDLIPGSINDPGAAPNILRGLSTTRAIYGWQGAGTGEGNWTIVGGHNQFYSVILGDLPRLANIQGVAVDTYREASAPAYCAISDQPGVGLRCATQSGGVFLTDTTRTGNAVEVYQNNVFIDNGTITRYKIQGASLVEQASTLASSSVGKIRMSKDGRYLYVLDDATVEVLDASTLERVALSTSFASALRSFDVDSANNFAYALDQTTIYKVALFNHTESDGGWTPVGTQNPGVDLETTTPGDGGGGGGGGPAPGTPFDVSDLDPFTGSTTNSGLFAAALLIAAVTAAGRAALRGRAGITVGAFVGSTIAFAVGWIPDWMVVVLVLGGAVLLVLRFR